MRELKERVAYLQGLTEGLDVRDQSKEGRIINSLIEVMGEVVDNLDTLWDAHQQLEDYMETIDEDLYHLEGGELDDDLDEQTVEVTCPRCSDRVSFDSNVIEDGDVIEVTCPSCDEVVYVNDGSYDYSHSIINEEPPGPDHQVTPDI